VHEITVIWTVMLQALLERIHCFRGTCCLDLAPRCLLSWTWYWT